MLSCSPYVLAIILLEDLPISCRTSF
uniref:Uncharacterized protein n=1 Tax=Rhizophora mucronata TaxID=61149 RepID=A0A2P2QHP0_RHIMU